jgi:HEAT repeat protein
VIPDLFRCLATSEADVREFIVDILGEIGQPSCVAELLPYLRDADDNVRYAVVETFGKLKAKTAVSALLELLEEADTGLCFTILEALAAIGTGVPVARIAPYSEDRLLRKAVFNCLGRLVDVQALHVLVTGVADPLRKTRDAALLAIGEIIKGLPFEVPLPPVAADLGDYINLVCDYLGHDDVAMRRAACHALCIKPDLSSINKVLALLADEELRSDVVAACWRLPENLLFALLDGVSVTDELAPSLVYLFGELHCQAIIPLAIAGLTADNPQLRYVSALALGKVSAKKAITRLGDLLFDPVGEIREAAAEALRTLGADAPTAVIGTLGPFLESDDAGLRLLAVRTLAALPAGKVEDILLLALKDVAPEVRCEALRSLKGGVSPRLLSGLSLALTDEVADVRRLAAEALAAYPPQQVLSILAYAADDSDPWVRMAAIRSVPGGNEQDIEAIVKKGAADGVGLVVIAALETAIRLLPSRAAEYLSGVLESPDQDVVVTAVRLLLAEGWAEKLLVHDSARVRLAVVRELERQEETRWVGLFSERLDSETNSEVRAALATALRRGQAGA